MRCQTVQLSCPLPRAASNQLGMKAMASNRAL